MEEEVRENEIIERVRYTRTLENQPLLQEEESESVSLIKSSDGVKTAEVYTVEDAVNYMGFGPFQIAVTVFAGMIWLSDAMEVMLLSVLSPILQCEWNLETWEEAFITSIVFIGFFFGGLTWGIVADTIGRKLCLLIVDIIVLVFGLLSAVAPSYPWLLVFRFVAGFGVAGGAQAVTYYVEFLPKKMRGICIVLLEVWWAIGSVFAALLALGVIPNISRPLHWRVYLALCALPLALVLGLFIIVPESARYYISKNNMEKGEKVIKYIAWINRTTPPSGRLVSQEEKESLNKSNLKQKNSNDVMSEQEPLLVRDESPPPPNTFRPSSPKTRTQKLQRKLYEAITDLKNGILMMFKNKMWRTTVPLVFIWFGVAWLYYGAVLLTTTILELEHNPCHNVNQSAIDSCRNLSTTFYLKIVWTSAAEFPVTFFVIINFHFFCHIVHHPSTIFICIILTLIIIEIIGRKITMAIELIGTGLFFGLILVCVPDIYLTLFLFGARGFITGAFQTVFVYTPEVYPTRARGVSLGMMTSAARVGALITPFIAQALYPVSNVATIGLYVGSCVFLCIASLILPIETKGKSLKDTHG